VTRRRLHRRARPAAAALVVAAAAFAAPGALPAPPGYALQRLVSDGGVPAQHRDRRLVNGWGLAAGPAGPWWTGNEANDSSTLYSGAGRKQLLSVTVAGGPTGIAYYGGKQFLVSAGGRTDPARFLYACEDGRIRAWTPTVPAGWSKQTETVVDDAGDAAIFRGVAIAGERLYATDFHNGRVDVYDAAWRRVRLPGVFVDRAIPAWYAPSGIAALGGNVFVTYVWRAPVNGNDAPTGGYVDEFSRDGRLLARVARGGALNEPWGLALAPPSFGRFGGDLLVGNFGDGHVNAYRRGAKGWAFDGALDDAHGRPIAVNGLWGIAFGNGSTAGPVDTLFFASGPHEWRGETELGVHGLIGSISAR
jgi:uncharacterized protein (TIGR03118 family)